VRAAGAELADQARDRAALGAEAGNGGRRQDPVPGDGGATPGDHGEAGPVPGIPSDRRLDPATWPLGYPGDDREVAAGHLPGGEGCGQADEGLLRGRDEQQPRGVTVEPVDDAGTVALGPRRQRDTGRLEGLHEGAVGMASTGVDDQPGRLGDHEQVLVAVPDRRQRWWRRSRRRCRRDHLHLLVGTQPPAPADTHTSHADLPSVDTGRGLTPGDPEVTGEPDIQTLPVSRGGHPDRVHDRGPRPPGSSVGSCSGCSNSEVVPSGPSSGPSSEPSSGLPSGRPAVGSTGTSAGTSVTAGVGA
jgi:hypothetical protein